MDKPTIELRQIKLSRSLSEETNAYTAQIWVDGKHFCDVSNHGQGGPDTCYPPKGMTNAAFQPLLAELEARIKATHPKTDVSYLYKKPPGSEFLDASLEQACGSLLADHDFAQRLKRDLRTKILFVKPDGLYACRKPKGSQEAVLVGAIKNKHGLDRVLNEMPFEEALRVYATAGAR